MDADRIDRVTGWDSESFSDGFDGLRALADRDFSGAVTDGAAWLFMLNGRIVGVVDGDLEGFGTASGTAYEAPHESLPLLYAMLEQGGRERAQYYTNDTPLADADRKLSAGNFTGYIELSENVLSGDYYVAYYGGNSLSAAFTGSSNDTLKTGEEAFELANDEVGIYTVTEVDLDVREVPESSGSASSTSGSAAAAGTVAGNGSGSSELGNESPGGSGVGGDGSEGGDSSGDADGSEGADGSDVDVGSAAVTDAVDDAEDASPTGKPDGSADRSGPVDPSPGAAPSESSAADRTADPDAAEATPADNAADAEPASGDETGSGPDAEPTTTSSPSAEGSAKRPPSSADEGPAADADGESAPTPDEDVFSEEEEWRETKSIPALDPDESADVVREQQSGSGARTASSSTTAGDDAATGTGSTTTSTSPSTASKGSASSSSPSTASRSGSNADAGGTGGEASGASASTEDVTERESVKRSQLHRRVNRLESALEETEAKRKALVEERDQIAAERDDLRETNERLESRVAELEAELEDVRGDLREARSQLPDGDQVITPAEAREGTNLFVRYGSQGGATLEKAHDGEIDREELVSNLKLEHHTSFEADGVVVQDQPYEQFLHETMEYGFTQWLIEDLLFEIQDTGNVSALQEVYDAIPEIDRAEIGGTVQIVHEENGEETREQRSFDLVLRNRMGNPLFVADLNASRDPTAKGSLDQLVEDSSLVAETGDEFASAFAVTSSFFKPGALETADDATGGGLLSRSKKKSYVKISRKQGYHLCLAESRDGGFHLTVPEL